MNYRHGFHAGNFADVLKHAAFLHCLDDLAKAAAPFCAIDTHAGQGIYDLSGAEAAKTGEWRNGVARVLDAALPPPLIARYADAVRAAQTPGFAGMQLYPGSPRLALQIIRPRDRLIALELHPPSAALLDAALQARGPAHVNMGDGYAKLPDLLPPREGRGIVLIDPPFEAPDEFERLARAVKSAFDRWEGGTFFAWYPAKDAPAAARFEAELQTAWIPNVLVAELCVQSPSERMAACRIAVVNPPPTLEPALAGALPWLAQTLALGDGAGWWMDWLDRRK